jgi:hypothetical protein
VTLGVSISGWGERVEREWVVLLEAAPGESAGAALELTALEDFLGALADCGPSALYAADRYAVQLALAGPDPHGVLGEGVRRWRAAVTEAGLPPWELVRAEVKTVAEHEAENRAERPPVLPSAMTVTVDAEALEAAYRATRALVGAETVQDIRVILATLVYSLGGAVVPSSRPDPDAVPVDLGFGEPDPMVAVADSYSIARLRLEELLPLVMEDARAMVARLRRDDLARRD